MKKRRFRSGLLIVICLILTACAPGQVLSLTAISNPTETLQITSTLIPTDTVIPTATIDATATAKQIAYQELTATAAQIEYLSRPAQIICNDQKGIPESAEYDPSSPTPPLLICVPYGGCESPASYFEEVSVSPELSKLSPNKIQDLQLVLCIDHDKRQKIPTGKYCNYAPAGGGNILSIPLSQVIDVYDLYIAKTGKKIKSFNVPGIPPDPWENCPTFLENNKEILGDSDNAALLKQISKFLNISIP